jgi:ubiquitin-like 1-activating enzyme E1 B
VKLAPIPETPQKIGIKRPLPVEMEDGVLDLAPTPKKVKMSSQSAQKFGCSPAKKRCLEEQGLVAMDGPGDLLERESFNGTVPELDVIIIDD